MGDLVKSLERKRAERELRDLTAGQNAGQALEGLRPGCELFGFTVGQFSLINLLIVALEKTGPADVTLTTWTAARKEIGDANRLLRSGFLRSIRFLVDYSFPRRQPAYCKLLRDRFGDESIRLSKCHAKFILIRNDGWNLVIRTSMNLNKNARFEQFEVSDDLAMADYLEGVVDRVFTRTAADETFELRPQEHKDRFEGFGSTVQSLEDYSHWGASLDDPSKPGTERLF
jgi:hypothetical protein